MLKQVKSYFITGTSAPVTESMSKETKISSPRVYKTLSNLAETEPSLNLASHQSFPPLFLMY